MNRLNDANQAVSSYYDVSTSSLPLPFFYYRETTFRRPLEPLRFSDPPGVVCRSNEYNSFISQFPGEGPGRGCELCVYQPVIMRGTKKRKRTGKIWDSVQIHLINYVEPERERQEDRDDGLIRHRFDPIYYGLLPFSRPSVEAVWLEIRIICFYLAISQIVASDKLYERGLTHSPRAARYTSRLLTRILWDPGILQYTVRRPLFFKAYLEISITWKNYRRTTRNSNSMPRIWDS